MRCMKYVDSYIDLIVYCGYYVLCLFSSNCDCFSFGVLLCIFSEVGEY